jgi:transposase
MQPYSQDLRVRVMAALERGERRGDVADRFAVSVPTITRWVRRRRETGGLAPTPVPGPPAVKLNALRAALPARLTDHADATLADQCAWWREQSGVQVSTATMSRALTRLGERVPPSRWTRKKSR